jgi:hypothetical protein
MDNNASINTIDQGKNMRLAFEYVQQIFRETSQLMKKLDSLMGKDWVPTYGNRTTRDVTSHIDEPDGWLVEAVFRIYNSRKEPRVKKGITIAFWGDDIEEPILVAGKLKYVVDKTSKKIAKDNHWDLWGGWFYNDSGVPIADGVVRELNDKSKVEHVLDAKGFAIPLVSITSEKDIKTKIYDKLIIL